MGKKLDNISAIKVAMMLSVVFYHSMIFFGNNWITFASPKYTAKYLYIFAKWLNTFQIQTFCAVSGFLFYYMKYEKGKYKNPKSDIKKRSIRLIIPYFFTCIFWVIPLALLFENYSLPIVIKKYILMESPNQLWFLIMLFGVFVFFELFSDKIKMSKRTFFMIFVICTGIGYFLDYNNINIFQIARIIQFIVYFYLGGYLYINKDKITKKQIYVMILIFACSYSTNYYLNRFNSSVLYYFAKYMLTISSICGTCIVYYVITKIVDCKLFNLESKTYRILEDNTFGIYLFHQQIIYFVILFLNGNVLPVIQVIISFIISLIISLCISIILKKNKVTKKMFGL